MSKLKKQIEETEADLHATELYISAEKRKLAEDAQTPMILSALIAGSFIAGLILVQRKKIGIKTLYRLPLRITKLLIASKTFL